MIKRHGIKLLALMLTAVIMFTFIPKVFAEGPTDITGWVYIHDSEGESEDEDKWAEGKTKSYIEIFDLNGDKIDPDDEGHYHDVPTGASIKVQVGFHFDNDKSYDFDPGDYFTFPLPSGIDFSDSGSGGVITSVADEIDFATWVIVDGELKVTLTEGYDSLTSNIWGEVEFSGSFEALESEDDDASKTEIVFGSETIEIYREKYEEEPVLPDPSILGKSFTYDPNTNELTWTVTVTPPDDQDDYDFSGFTLIDTLTGNHTYKADSFKVNGDSASPTVSGSGNKKTITYEFPEDHTPVGQKQTITYVTTIDGIEAGKTNNFKNTASLKLGDDSMADDATSTFQMGGFFSKAANDEPIVKAEDGKVYIQWIVTVTVPKTPEGMADFVFPNARIIDSLTSGNHEYVTGESSYPVEIKYPGGSVATEVHPGTGKGQYSIDTEGTELTYLFGEGHPKTSSTGPQTYVLTYYTVVTDWDEHLDSNEAVDAKNKAKFEWFGDWDEGTGTGTGGGSIGDVEAKKNIASKGGLISKATTDTKSFDHSAAANTTQGDCIKWTIVVNRNKVPMTGIYIEDTVQEGHDLVINDEYPLTVVKNAGTDTVEYTESGEKAYGTLAISADDPPTNFTFTFPSEQSNDTYTLVFYTKINQAGFDDMYRNGTKTFINEVVLEGHGEDGIPAEATKTYNLRMLRKTVASEYNFETRRIQYKLDINRNRLPLKDAIITDTLLPMDLKLSPATAEAFEVSVNGETAVSLYEAGIGFSYDQSKNEFTLTLPDTVGGIGDRYEISYWAHLEDSALLETGTITLNNSVLFTMDKNSTGLTDSTTISANYETITKSHDYDAEEGGDGINWTVEINPGQAELDGAFVEDTLNDYLELVADSVKLFEAVVNPDNGTLSKGGPVDISSLLVVEDNNKHFRLNLPDGQKAYILEFITLILKDDETFVNKIELKGEEGNPAGEGTSNEVVVKKRYAHGGSGSYALDLKKVNEKDEPMEGVSFKLLTSDLEEFKYKGSDPPSITQQTNAEGIVSFTKLPPWVFYVQEVDPLPEGYLSAGIVGPFVPSQDETEPDGLIVNYPAEIDIFVNKMSYAENPEERLPLDGGSFGIYPDGNGKALQTVPAEGGIVKFAGIVPGDYVIREVEAPAGYAGTSAELPVTVSFNDDFTGLDVIFGDPSDADEIVLDADGGYVFINRVDGKIVIYKEGEDKEPLAGAVFQLLNEDKTPYLDEDGNVSQGITDDRGILEFDQLPVGTYYLREVEAPPAYFLLEEDVEVVLNLEEGGWQPQVTVENKLLRASVSLQKIDQDGEPLSGGLFGIYDPEDIRFETPLLKVEAVEGLILFEGLLPGGYIIREIEAPKDYQLTDEVIGVKLEIGKDNTLADIELEEKLVNVSSLLAGGDDQNKDGDKDKGDLVTTGGLLDATMLWLLGILLVLMGLLFLLRLKPVKER